MPRNTKSEAKVATVPKRLRSDTVALLKKINASKVLAGTQEIIDVDYIHDAVKEKAQKEKINLK